MRLFAVNLSAVVGLLLSSAVSQASEPCGTPKPEFAINNLYFFDSQRRCWERVDFTGFEDTLLDRLAELKPYTSRGGRTQFIYVVAPIPADSKTIEKTPIIIKQKIFLPKNAVVEPTQEVVLDRPSIDNNSPCRPKGALRAKNGKSSVNLSAYNRYHGQVFNFIPPTDELRDFHFQFPASAGGCQDTDSAATRGRYVFNNVNVPIPSLPVVTPIASAFLSTLSSLVTSAVARTITTVPFTTNTAYAELSVRHFIVDGKDKVGDKKGGRYAVARFYARSESSSAIEISVSPLVQILVPLRQTVWQLQWQ